jgi:cell division protein ZipA
MQDLRLVLIILGLFAIIALIAHGLWSNKKNQVKPLKDKPLNQVANNDKDGQGFDIDGIGAKRVVNNTVTSAVSRAVTGAVSGTVNRVVSKQLLTARASTTVPTPETVNSEKIEPQFGHSSAQAATVTTTVASPAVAPSATLAATEICPDAETDYQLLVKAEIIIDDADCDVVDDAKAETLETRAPEITDNDDLDEAVFVINIMARDGKVIHGAILLQELSALGFKFGEMDIFHRHVDAAGKGPVIFSLANMVKPGTFDVDYMEQFQTPGVSLFMMIPCAGEASRNYNMMLNAAERIANGIDALLLDVSRNPLTPQTIQHDKAIILEFERKALAKKSH